MKRFGKYYAAGLAVLVGVVLVRGQFAGAPVNEWTSSADMATSRAAACSVRIPDGRVLVSGGKSDAGVMASAELYSADGTSRTIAPMLQPRAEAGCVAMADGRVLVTGGTDGKFALASAEIYDPASDKWQDAGSMSVARSGHSAVLSPWGAVLIVGGEETGTLEAFLTNGTFARLGTFATARKDYAIVMTPNKQMLIFGGASGNSTLSSVEMFDPSTNVISSVGTMSVARRNFGAAALYDGTVLVSGGIDAAGNVLDSTEVFDPSTGKSAEGPAMAAPRANHQSMLLPNNGSVILVGGTDRDGVLASTEIYTPWTGKIAPTGKLRNARSSMASTLLNRGGVFVGGGRGLNGYLSATEQYHFATVESGKLDYHPGEVAAFTGSGWKAGEQVLLQIQSFPIDQHHLEFSAAAVADGKGEIHVSGFNVDASHLGARFLLTATGSQSKAQTLFTDGNPTTTSIQPASPSSVVYPGSVTINGTVTDNTLSTNTIVGGTVQIFVDGVLNVSPTTTANGGGGGNYTSAIANVNNALNPGVHSAQAFFQNCPACATPENASTSTSVSYTVTNTLTVATTTTPAGNGNLGTNVTLTATLTPGSALTIPNGSVDFAITGGGSFSPVHLTVNNVSSNVVTASISTLPGGNYTVTATYTPVAGNGYPTASGAIAYTVNPVDPTLLLSVDNITPVFGQTVNFTATVVGLNGFPPPQGSVTFLDGVTGVSSKVLSNGVAAFSTNTLSVNPHNFTFTYTASFAESNYNSPGGGSNTKTVTPTQAPAGTSITNTVPSSPSAFNQSVTFTGTVTSLGAQAAGYQINGVGKARFYDGATPITGCTSQDVNNGVATCTTSALTVGSHNIAMAFGVPNTDQNVATVPQGSATPLTYTVNAGSSISSVSSNNNPANLGSSITYTAIVTVTPSASFPTATPGTMAFSDNGTVLGACSAQTVAPNTPAPGQGQAVCTLTYDGTGALTAGAHNVTVAWTPGAATVNGSNNNSSPYAQTVKKALIDLSATPTLSAASPLVYGQPESVQQPVGLKPAGVVANPTQSLAIKDGATQVGTTAVVFSASTVAVALPSPLSLGNHSVQFVYPAAGTDPNYDIVNGSAVLIQVNQAGVTVSSSGFVPGAYGTNQIVGGTVAATAPATGTPGGTLTFSYSGTTLGSCTLAAGTCTATIKSAALPAGADTINIAYSGDTNFQSGTGSGTLNVTQNGLGSTLTASPSSPVANGASVTFTAAFTANGSGLGVPTGTVTFLVDGNSIGTAAINSGTGQAKFPTSSILAGTHTITATYPGDTNFSSPSIPAINNFVVNPPASTVTLTPSENPTSISHTVTYSFTVTNAVAGGPAPLGSVTLSDAIAGGGNISPECTNVTLIAGAGSSSSASCQVIYAPASLADVIHGVGNHPITANYTPNAPTWGAGSFGPVNVIVNKLTPTLSTPAFSATSTCLGQAPTLCFNYGTATDITTNITPATPTPAYTQNVAFSDNGITFGNSPIVAGVSTFSQKVLNGGTHTVKVAYPGDANYNAVDPPVVVIINKVAPTVSHTGGPFNGTYGGTMSSVSTTVAHTGSGAVPTGTVTLSSNGIQIGSPVNLAACGLDACATFTTPQLPNTILVGANQNLTITYNGDSNYSTGVDSGNNLNVTASAVNITVTSTSIPPAAAGNPLYSQTVTFTATAVGPGAPATGSVTFVNDGAQTIGGCGNVAFSASGNNAVATCTFPATDLNNLGVGPHTVSVTNFTGDTNHTAGTITPTVLFNVNPDPTTTLVVGNPNPLPNPGQPLAFVATVTLPAGLSAPLNGKVTFTQGSTTLCSAVALNGTSSGSSATCNVPANTAPFNTSGSYIVIATYQDTAVNAQTATSNGNVTEVVNKPVPVITLASDVPTSVYGQTVNLTATVTVTNGNPLPTGLLQFYDGGNTIGSALSIVGPNGANFVVYKLAVPTGGLNPFSVGSHAITATYIPNADPNYGQGNSQSQNPPVVLTQVVNKADTNVVNFNFTATPSTIVFGENVTISADLTPRTPSAATGLPTGQVIFFDAGNQIGSPVTIQNVGGVQRATLTTNTLSTGTHSQITAQYLGDGNFNGVLSGTSVPAAGPLSIPVNPDGTKTVLNTGTWPASPTYGAQITLSATACGLLPGSTTSCSNSLPIGLKSTISFFDGSTLLGTSGPVDGSGAASITVFMQNPPFINVSGNTVAGNHSITARYDGLGSPAGTDANFTQSTSAPAQTLVIGKANTTTTVTSDVNPSVYGQDVTFTATVAAPNSNAAAPSGSVTFSDGGVQIGNVALSSSGGAIIAKLKVGPGVGGTGTALTVGQHNIVATYTPDANSSGNYNVSSNSASPLVQTVNKASTTASTINSSANAANTGQQITLTVTIQPIDPGKGTPTGTVTFLNQAAPVQPSNLGTVTLVPAASGGSATATLVLPNGLPAGNPQIIAQYSGDTNFLPSNSPVLTQAINKSPSNIVLTSSLNPSIFGNQVTFGVTVTPVPPGTGTPTGLIEIFDGTVSLGTFTLQGGVYNFTTAGLSPGAHAIAVQYNGDTNFQPFTSPAIQQNVSKIPTSLNMTSNAFTAIASQVITLTAVLNPNPVPGVPFASGQIGFYDGTALIGVANLQSNVATLNIANLSVGLHQLSAIYTGDDRWTGSTSGFFAETITLASTATQIVSSANPSVVGQAVTFTISVTVPFPGTVPANGQVVLTDNNNNNIATSTTSNNGVYTITIPDFKPGVHNLIASFVTNGSFAGSSSTPLPQVVNKAATTTTLAALPNGSTSNQTVTMTAVVSVNSPGAGSPTGSVEFVNTTFQKSLGTAPLKLIGGVYTATLTTNQLNQSGAPQVLTATYSGDDNFATSTSNPQGQSVFGTQVTAVNGASQTVANYAPDMWVTLYGDNLASTTLTSSQVPYPTSLAGTTVTLTDANGTVRQAPLYFVSPNQINMLIPTNTAFGLATLTVTNPNGASSSTIVLVTRTAPGLFTANQGGTGTAAALVQRVKSDGSQSIEQVVQFNSSGQPVPLPIAVGNDSLYLQFYGTGLRYVASQLKVTATVGGVNAQVLYASAAPGFQGLDQVNIALPAGFNQHGTVNVVITVDGQAANTVTLTFQ